MGVCVFATILLQVDDERMHSIRSAPERWSLAGCKPTDILTHYMQPDDWNHIDDQGVFHC